MTPSPHAENLPVADRRFAKASLLIALSVWAIASAWGFLWLLSHSTTPGTAGTSQSYWPAKSGIERDMRHANLVLLVHPHCPCSRATITELAEIMARCDGLVTTHVLFLKPSQMPDGWEVTDLWHRAAAIPGVHVVSDQDGAEARRFGAETSGQALLYDPHGRLNFRGGITIARGHQGVNAGHLAVIDWLTRGIGGRTSEAVFGCPLFSDRMVAAEEQR